MYTRIPEQLNRRTRWNLDWFYSIMPLACCRGDNGDMWKIFKKIASNDQFLKTIHYYKKFGHDGVIKTGDIMILREYFLEFLKIYWQRAEITECIYMKTRDYLEKCDHKVIKMTGITTTGQHILTVTDYSNIEYEIIYLDQSKMVEPSAPDFVDMENLVEYI